MRAASTQDQDLLLLEQPRIRCILDKRTEADERTLKIWYLVAFEDFEDEQAEWYERARLLEDLPETKPLMQAFETARLKSQRKSVAPRQSFVPATQNPYEDTQADPSAAGSPSADRSEEPAAGARAPRAEVPEQSQAPRRAPHSFSSRKAVPTTWQEAFAASTGAQPQAGRKSATAAPQQTQAPGKPSSLSDLIGQPWKTGQNARSMPMQTRHSAGATQATSPAKSGAAPLGRQPASPTALASMARQMQQARTRPEGTSPSRISHRAPAAATSTLSGREAAITSPAGKSTIRDRPTVQPAFQALASPVGRARRNNAADTGAQAADGSASPRPGQVTAPKGPTSPVTRSQAGRAAEAATSPAAAASPVSKRAKPPVSPTAVQKRGVSTSLFSSILGQRGLKLSHRKPITADKKSAWDVWGTTLESAARRLHEKSRSPQVEGRPAEPQQGTTDLPQQNQEQQANGSTAAHGPGPIRGEAPIAQRTRARRTRPPTPVKRTPASKQKAAAAKPASPSRDADSDEEQPWEVIEKSELPPVASIHELQQLVIRNSSSSPLEAEASHHAPVRAKQSRGRPKPKYFRSKRSARAAAPAIRAEMLDEPEVIDLDELASSLEKEAEDAAGFKRESGGRRPDGPATHTRARERRDSNHEDADAAPRKSGRLRKAGVAQADMSSGDAEPLPKRHKGAKQSDIRAEASPVRLEGSPARSPDDLQLEREVEGSDAYPRLITFDAEGEPVELPAKFLPYFSEEGWAEAQITGARLEDAVLRVHIVWKDGLDKFISNQSLKQLPHCLLSLVSFYESRIKHKMR